MDDLTKSLIRSALKVVGAGLITKGYTDEATVEAAIGALITLAGIAWSAYHHWKSKQTNETK